MAICIDTIEPGVQYVMIVKDFWVGWHVAANTIVKHKNQCYSCLLSLYRSYYLPLMPGCPEFQIPHSLPCPSRQLPILNRYCHARANQCALDVSLRLVSKDPTQTIGESIRAYHPDPPLSACTGSPFYPLAQYGQAHHSCPPSHQSPSSR